MGAVNGCFIPRGEFEKSCKTSTPKEKGHRRNLSATFNMSVVENSSVDSSLVNVNKASEEELMTLPGVNRVIAKSIVDYRNHIGGFRKVEDLALTPGVGAVKLAMMRSEIYVDSPTVDESDERKQNPRPQQGDSEPAICINSSNIFKLMRVQGIGLTIAKNIVAHRDKHGRYKKVDELLKVKGIGPNNLEEMRHFFTVDDKHQTVSKTDNGKNGICMNGTAGNKAAQQDHLDKEYIHRSTSSLENLLDILGPLAKVPERPKVEKVILTYKKCPVFRLASWNLDKFSQEKASNPGVKDVICMTVLENGFGLVAVQELLDKDALFEICRELNSPTLPNVKKWTGRRGQWSCVISETASCTRWGKEYQGFLYDTTQNIELKECKLLEHSSGEDKAFTHMPFLGIFQVNQGLHVAVVNVHLKTAGLSDEDLTKSEDKAQMIYDIAGTAARGIKDKKFTVILGDFSQISSAKGVSDNLRTKGYVQCIPSETLTSTSASFSKDGKCCGNIWVSKEAKVLYTGVSGVVRDGLSSNWIPSGWSWGGVVSNDCPVYAQLYCSKDSTC